MYFESKARKSQSSVLPKVLGVVGLVALVGGGFFYMRVQQSEKKTALRQGLVSALGSGSYAQIKPALDEVVAAGQAADPDTADLVTEARWVLWANDGIKTEPLDAAALDAVNTDSPLPLIVARAERDLLRGDLNRGQKFLTQATSDVKFTKEPVLAELQARFLLNDAETDPTEAQSAIDTYITAMETLGKAPADAMPISKAWIEAGYARACMLAGNHEGAVNNYKDAAASAPDLGWAAIGSEIAQIAPDADQETADAALVKVLDAHKDKLSPRQTAFIQLERARRDLANMSVDKAIEPLKAAMSADPSYAEPAYQLGQIYLDMGKLSDALAALDAAYQLAPYDMRIVTAKVTTQLMKGDASGAQSVIAQIPEPYNGFRHARVLKARLQRESGAITDAPTLIDETLKSSPGFFEAQLEQALLSRAKNSPDAEKQMRALIPAARTAGRYAYGPVLQAYAATLTAPKARARAMQEAQAVAETWQNAQALAILGEAMIASKDVKGAAAVLDEAKKYGDLPQIEKLSAQVAQK